MSEPEKQETLVELDVPAGYREQERLDVYVTRFLPNASRSKVQQGIRDGNVSIDGAVVSRPSRPVQAGERIVCRIMRPPPMEILPEPIPLRIIYEDDDVIVVDKEAGMVVHPAYGNRTGTLVHALLYHVGAGPLSVETDDGEEDDDDPGLSTVNAGPRFEGDPVARPGIVHRLDKDTSGLMVVARNDVAHTRLAKQFAAHTIRRRYEAIVWGRPDPLSGRIETDVGRDPRDRKRMAVLPDGRGKRAVTHYETIGTMAFTAHVAFRLETGRTHQIRVHAKHVGHPVLADATYGGARIAAGPDTARRRAFFRNVFEALPRQALHARTLGFRHPVTGDEMDFDAPLPDDMAAALEALQRGDPV